MTWGSALVNHTYKTLNVSNFIACVLKCDEDPQCRSCNFWWNKLECELNYAATYSAATSFIREVNCVHRDMDWEPGMYNNLNSFSFFFSSSTILVIMTPITAREEENGRARSWGQEASGAQDFARPFFSFPFIYGLARRTERSRDYLLTNVYSTCTYNLIRVSSRFSFPQ